jgi:hypothetical protein
MWGNYEIPGTASSTILLASLRLAARRRVRAPLSDLPALRDRLRIRLERHAADGKAAAAAQRSGRGNRIAQADLMELVMIPAAQSRFRPRAPRVTLPECVLATIQLENSRQIPAKLQRISLTGGLLDLAVFVEERVPVSLTLPIGSGIVVARAEMLFPMRGATGYLQPFRFTSLRAEQLHILEREITDLLQRTQGSAATSCGLGLRPPSSLLELL